MKRTNNLSNLTSVTFSSNEDNAIELSINPDTDSVRQRKLKIVARIVEVIAAALIAVITCLATSGIGSPDSDVSTTFSSVVEEVVTYGT